MSNFSGLTPQMMAMGNNYNTAYARSTNMIPPPNFTNTGHLVHNNMGAIISTEQIEIYNIYADGKHRDTSVYPNPFSFPIEFKNYGKGVKVGRELVRTKFVRLDGLILPNYNSMSYDVYNDEFIYDTNDPDTSIVAKKYIIIRIEQLKDYHKFTSGDFMKDNTFVCRLDKDLGNNHSYWIPITRDTVTFKNSAPQPISKLDISIYDSDENLLEPRLSYNSFDKIPFNFDTTISDLQALLDDSTITDPFSGETGEQAVTRTIDQINKIKKDHQIKVILSIGVIENDLNTNNR
jgi:hypothetical protein